MTTTSSISSTLGVGSGVDFAALTTQLVDAAYSTKLTALTTQNTQLTAQISGVSTLKSGITSFSSAMTSLVKSGSLTTQPTSSNTSVLSVSGLAGAALSGFSASVEVRQLASAQSAATSPMASHTAPIGTGKLTLTLGTGSVTNGALTSFTPGSGTPVDITIDSTNSSLDGIAAAINAKNAGVTATVVSDSDGSRLMLKGKTGGDQAFTLTATEDSSAPGLAALNVGPGATGTTIGTPAQDAIVAIDGTALKRSSNSISDLIPGVQLNLNSAAPGTTVTLGTQSPSAAISQAVSDFVDTYNQFQATLAAQTDPATGALHSDPAAKSLTRSLAQLTLTKLVANAPAGAPTTLADLGVATNRDGTLSVNADQLAAALAKNPAGVEAMFADGSGASGGGLAAALSAVSDAAISTTYGLGASAANYTKAQSTIADQQTTISAAEDQMRTQLTAQFAATDAKVASYKATQDYLKQQVAAWNGSSSS
jgi:flagellar hook-associated protein 2